VVTLPSFLAYTPHTFMHFTFIRSLLHSHFICRLLCIFSFVSLCNVPGSVHRKNILIYIQQDATLHSLFYLETALHVSGGTNTHHQDRKQLYLQHLVFVTPLMLSAAIVGELGPVLVRCGWRTPPTAQSNRFQLFHDSDNGLTNTRCCRYSCLRSWWWVLVAPETCRAVSG
jgi:hypothetical protein